MYTDYIKNPLSGTSLLKMAMLLVMMLEVSAMEEKAEPPKPGSCWYKLYNIKWRKNKGSRRASWYNARTLRANFIELDNGKSCLNYFANQLNKSGSRSKKFYIKKIMKVTNDTDKHTPEAKNCWKVQLILTRKGHGSRMRNRYMKIGEQDDAMAFLKMCRKYSVPFDENFVWDEIKQEDEEVPEPEFDYTYAATTYPLCKVYGKNCSECSPETQQKCKSCSASGKGIQAAEMFSLASCRKNRTSSHENRNVYGVLSTLTNNLAYFKFKGGDRFHIQEIGIPNERNGEVFVTLKSTKKFSWIRNREFSASLNDVSSKKFLHFCRRHNVPSVGNWLQTAFKKHMGGPDVRKNVSAYYLYALKNYRKQTIVENNNSGQEWLSIFQNTPVSEQTEVPAESPRRNTVWGKSPTPVLSSIKFPDRASRSPMVDQAENNLRMEHENTIYTKIDAPLPVAEEGAVRDDEKKEEEHELPQYKCDEKHRKLLEKEIKGMTTQTVSKKGEMHHGDIDVHTMLAKGYAHFKIQEGGILGCTGGIAYLFKGMRTGSNCKGKFTQGFTDSLTDKPKFETTIQKMIEEVEKVTLIDLTVSTQDGKKYQHVWIGEKTKKSVVKAPQQGKPEQIIHHGRGYLALFKKEIQYWLKNSCVEKADLEKCYIEVIRQAMDVNGKQIKMSWTPGVMKYLEENTGDRECVLMFDNGGGTFRVTKKNGSPIISGNYAHTLGELSNNVKGVKTIDLEGDIGTELQVDEGIQTLKEVLDYVARYLKKVYEGKYSMANVGVGYTGTWRSNRKFDKQRAMYDEIYMANGIDKTWIQVLDNFDEGVYMGFLMDRFIEGHRPKMFTNKVCCEVSSTSGQFYRPFTNKRRNTTPSRTMPETNSRLHVQRSNSFHAKSRPAKEATPVQEAKPAPRKSVPPPPPNRMQKPAEEPEQTPVEVARRVSTQSQKPASSAGSTSTMGTPVEPKPAPNAPVMLANSSAPAPAPAMPKQEAQPEPEPATTWKCNTCGKTAESSQEPCTVEGCEKATWEKVEPSRRRLESRPIHKLWKEIRQMQALF